jgi:hypothetical protein
MFLTIAIVAVSSDMYSVALPPAIYRPCEALRRGNFLALATAVSG